MGALSRTFMAVPMRNGGYKISMDGQDCLRKIPSEFVALKMLSAYTDAYIAGQTAETRDAFDRYNMFHGKQSSFRQLTFEGTEYGQISLALPGPPRMIKSITGYLRTAFAQGFQDRQETMGQVNNCSHQPRF